MPKYNVPVTWSICAMAEVEANNEEEAADLATGMDLDTFECAEYVPESFEVDWDNIRYVNAGEEEIARTERMEKIRMSSE